MPKRLVRKKFRGVHGHGIILHGHGEQFKTIPETSTDVGSIVRGHGRTERKHSMAKAHGHGKPYHGHGFDNPSKHPERQRRARPWGLIPTTVGTAYAN